MPNIKLKGQTGEVLTFEDVERVYFDSADQDGEVVYYTHGTAVTKSVEPNFASGDMNVPIADGELVTQLTIEKPDELNEDNIRSGATVAGVKGKFIGDTEEVTVGTTESGDTYELDFSGGNVVVEPTAPGKVISKATILKPGTLAAENIRKNVEIGGIVGEFMGDTEEKTVALSMADGDQVIVPSEEGKVLTQVTVEKPETLIPENVRSGIDVGGVVGSFLGDTEEATVTLDFTNGTQTVEPSAAGKVLSKVNIPMPDTLLPENIAEGIDIAGIIGTFAGGGGEIKVAAGSFTGSGSVKTITHNLGVVPDVIYIGTSKTPSSSHTSYNLSNFFGISEKLKIASGMAIYGHLIYAMYMGGNPYFVIRETTAIDAAAVSSMYVGVHSANEQSFVIGVSGFYALPRSGMTYYWIAIGGLT